MLIALFVLSGGLYEILSRAFFDSGFSDAELWYAPIYGYAAAQTVGNIVFILIVAFVVIVRVKKLSWEKVLSSRTLRIVEFLLILAVMLFAFIAPQNYDVVHIENDQYTFSAHRIGQPPSTYTIEEVVSMQVKSASEMSLQMEDGASVFIAFGIERRSDGFSASGYKNGQVPYEVCQTLVERGVPVLSAHQESIQKEIRKYSARSNSDQWQIYMPYIMSQVKST